MKDANIETIQKMKQRCALKIKNTLTYINSKLRGEILREEMGFITQHKRFIPQVEARAREMVAKEVVPMHKKIHIKPFFKRQIQKSSYFKQANRPAQRNLKRIIEDASDKGTEYRPKIGVAQHVTGAITKEDVIRLQVLKQELIDTKELERMLA